MDQQDSSSSAEFQSARQPYNQVSFLAAFTRMYVSPEQFFDFWHAKAKDERRRSGIRIEATILFGVSSSVVRDALTDVNVVMGSSKFEEPQVREQYEDAVERVIRATVQGIKSSSGKAEWSFSYHAGGRSGSVSEVVAPGYSLSIEHYGP